MFNLLSQSNLLRKSFFQQKLHSEKICENSLDGKIALSDTKEN